MWMGIWRIYPPLSRNGDLKPIRLVVAHLRTPFFVPRKTIKNLVAYILTDPDKTGQLIYWAVFDGDLIIWLYREAYQTN